jgi:hypothetical protein
MRARVLGTVILFVVWATASIQPVLAQVAQVPFVMTAFAVNMTNNGTGGNQVFEIRVNSWSTAAERQRLIDLAPKGQDNLLKAMSKEKSKGIIRIPGWQGPDPQNYKLGWDLRYTWHDALPEGGERIVIGLDRQMSMAELWNQPRSVDYPFTFLEIHMPKQGKGQGRMMGFTQVKFDKKTNSIVMEQYSAGPVQLNEVTIVKK